MYFISYFPVDQSRGNKKKKKEEEHLNGEWCGPRISCRSPNVSPSSPAPEAHLRTPQADDTIGERTHELTNELILELHSWGVLSLNTPRSQFRFMIQFVSCEVDFMLFPKVMFCTHPLNYHPRKEVMRISPIPRIKHKTRMCRLRTSSNGSLASCNILFRVCVYMLCRWTLFLCQTGGRRVWWDHESSHARS